MYYGIIKSAQNIKVRNANTVHFSEKRFDLVLFWSLDRFSREGIYETLAHLQKLGPHGVEW